MLNMLLLASLVSVLAFSSAVYVPRVATAPTTTSKSTVNHCSTLLLGRKTDDQIQLRQRTVGSHDYLYVADECSKNQKKWVGESITACDSVGLWPPTIMPFGIGNFSPLYINCAQENPHPCYELINVFVTLYCENASPNSL